jgi:penicillin-binding protein 1A
MKYSKRKKKQPFYIAFAQNTLGGINAVFAHVVKTLSRRPTDWPMIAAYGTVLAGAGALSAFILTTCIYHGVFGHLPSERELREIRNQNASEVYSEDGAVLGRYFIQNRVNASFDEIPELLRNALIATEDARFQDHKGIDLRAMLRVLIKSILLAQDSAGGGSTLSQQLAKNLYPRSGHGRFSLLVNKIKEMIIARRLERLYDKSELIGLYLNTVPFSDNIYGVKVAAHRFFGKTPQLLKPEEMAVLVGMLKGTALYHPVKHPERALERRNTVLRQMQKYGYISPEEADVLCAKPMRLKYSADGHNTGTATYFREHLRQEILEILKNHRKKDGTPYNLYSDGLKIYTTIDSRLQYYAELAVKTHLPALQQLFNREWRNSDPVGNKNVLYKMMQMTPRFKDMKARGYSEKEILAAFNTPREMSVFQWGKDPLEKVMSPLDSLKYYLRLLNTGFVAMDPASGGIKAWVGGIDIAYLQYDHVKSRRQVGSTFKPFVYAQAIESGVAPCRMFPNDLLTYEDFEGWTPENADGEYGGLYSMEGALTKSVNTISVQLIMETGVSAVRDMARALGLKGFLPKTPSIALGTAEASLLEMVQAFSAFANNGVKPEYYFLKRITTEDGEIIAEFDPPRARNKPLSETTAAFMLQMLRSVVNDGTASRLRWRYGLSNLDLAGKTGTTQNQSDGWFIGITPRLVAGAWVGAETPAVHFRTLANGQGANTALPVFGEFMRRVNQDRRFRTLTNARFDPLPDSLYALLDCPAFIHPDSTYQVEELLNDPGDLNFFQRLQAELTEPQKNTLPIRLKPQRVNEVDSQYLNRMQQYNERLQDREERKNKWKKILFGNKDQEQDP